MMITAVASLLCGLAGPAGADLGVSVEAPGYYVQGEPFVVEVTYTAGDEGDSLEAWRFGAAAFDVDGKPLAKRSADAKVPLGAGASVTVRMDLAKDLMADANFRLSVPGAKSEPVEVRAFRAAPAGLDFLTCPADQLKDYDVLMRTNRGDMLFEMWPDVAPNHVRNFLDLCYTGFYDGVLFHRVSPNFMIQGGDPYTKADNKNLWGTGNGPRTLDAEFNDKKHERGVLSMARGPSPNSASCQFFIMTVEYPALDGKYSVFGHMISGDATLDKIANAKGRVDPRDQTVRPDEPQRIEKCLLLQPVSGS